MRWSEKLFWDTLLFEGKVILKNGRTAPLSSRLKTYIREGFIPGFERKHLSTRSEEEIFRNMNRAFQDSHAEVRAHMACFLGLLAESKWFPYLKDLAEHDEDQGVRRCAILAIGELDLPDGEKMAFFQNLLRTLDPHAEKPLILSVLCVFARHIPEKTWSIFERYYEFYHPGENSEEAQLFVDFLLRFVPQTDSPRPVHWLRDFLMHPAPHIRKRAFCQVFRAFRGLDPPVRSRFLSALGTNSFLHLVAQAMHVQDTECVNGYGALEGLKQALKMWLENHPSHRIELWQRMAQEYENLAEAPVFWPLDPAYGWKLWGTWLSDLVQHTAQAQRFLENLPPSWLRTLLTAYLRIHQQKGVDPRLEQWLVLLLDPRSSVRMHAFELLSSTHEASFPFLLEAFVRILQRDFHPNRAHVLLRYLAYVLQKHPNPHYPQIFFRQPPRCKPLPSPWDKVLPELLLQWFNHPDGLVMLSAMECLMILHEGAPPDEAVRLFMKRIRDIPLFEDAFSSETLTLSLLGVSYAPPPPFYRILDILLALRRPDAALTAAHLILNVSASEHTMNLMELQSFFDVIFLTRPEDDPYPQEVLSWPLPYIEDLPNAPPPPFSAEEMHALGKEKLHIFREALRSLFQKIQGASSTTFSNNRDQTDEPSLPLKVLAQLLCLTADRTSARGCLPFLLPRWGDAVWIAALEALVRTRCRSALPYLYRILQDHRYSSEFQERVADAIVKILDRPLHPHSILRKFRAGPYREEISPDPEHPVEKRLRSIVESTEPRQVAIELILLYLDGSKWFFHESVARYFPEILKKDLKFWDDVVDSIQEFASRLDVYPSSTTHTLLTREGFRELLQEMHATHKEVFPFPKSTYCTSCLRRGTLQEFLMGNLSFGIVVCPKCRRARHLVTAERVVGVLGPLSFAQRTCKHRLHFVALWDSQRHRLIHAEIDDLLLLAGWPSQNYDRSLRAWLAAWLKNEIQGVKKLYVSPDLSLPDDLFLTFQRSLGISPLRAPEDFLLCLRGAEESDGDRIL